MSEDTTVKLSKQTVQRLKDLMKYGDTYDIIINRILDAMEKAIKH